MLIDRFRPFVLRVPLALAIGLASASCGQHQAELEAQARLAAEKTEAAAIQAKEAATELASQVAEDAEDLTEELAVVLDDARRFLVGTRDDLAGELEEALATLDVELAGVKRDLDAASDEVRARTGLLVAAVETKRQILATKLSALRASSGEAWKELQPDLEKRLADLESDLATAAANVARLVEGDRPAGLTDHAPAPPTELFEVVKVVDGDTIHVMRDGKKEKLRLLSVDTEEKLSGRPFNPNKPETLFGEEAKVWAIDFFASLAGEDGKTRVGLAFPDGEEAYDIYGRLLCHVILADGTDFNLKLVQDGWSPYFNKYGYSRICHEAFVAAQDRAREQQLGVWDPETNAPASPGEPKAARDYERLLPWWTARAEAVRAYRVRSAGTPGAVVSAEDPVALEEAVERTASTGYPISVFGTIERTFEESDGSLTLLLRDGGEDAVEFRAKIPQRLRADYAGLAPETRNEPYRQNYLFVVGKPVHGDRGVEITVTDRHSLQLGAPDPEYPEESAEEE